MKNQIRLIVADDHPIFRSGLKFLLESSFEGALVKALENGVQVLENIPTHNPSVVLLYIDMPVKNGLDTCAEIKELYPTIHVIILSIHKTLDIIQVAFSKGANGYLIKDNTSEEIVSCIQTVLSGTKYFPLHLRGNEDSKKIDYYLEQLSEEIHSLTPTELKVLKLVSKQHSSKEIADLLFVSPKSIENYRSRICKKLNLDARNNSLLHWVMEHKYLLDLD